MLKKMACATAVLMLTAVMLWVVVPEADAGHTYNQAYNPTTCANCHNAEHAGLQEGKTIFPGYPWLYRSTSEFDASGVWQNYTSYTILSTPTLDPLGEFCLKCHGNPRWRSSSHLSEKYINPTDGHIHHPIGVEITDDLISRRGSRTPSVLQDVMAPLSEMQETFYLGGPNKNVLTCATCHGYMHKGDGGPYGHYLTLPFDDDGNGIGGTLCGACHKGKWQDLHQ